jgi:hypothetical protein
MTIGKRNFIDSSKAKRRARRLPDRKAAGHGTEKNESGFSQKCALVGEKIMAVRRTGFSAIPYLRQRSGLW